MSSYDELVPGKRLTAVPNLPAVPTTSSNGSGPLPPHVAAALEVMEATALTVEQLYTLPPLVPLIAGVLDKGALAVMVGKWASYKSFIALDWACCVSLGWPWQMHETTQTRVLYVCAEGVRGMPKRVRAWEQRFGARPDVLFYPKPISLLDVVAMQALTVYSAGHGIGFSIFDTYNRSLIGGDENDSRDASNAVNNVSEYRNATGATALLLHHPPRTGANPRGHGAVDGGVDATFSVTAEGPESITVTNPKQKDDAAAEDIQLRSEVVELPDFESSCVLQSRIESHESRIDSTAATAIKSHFESHWSHIGASAGSIVEAMDMHRATVFRALNTLVKDGTLEKKGPVYYLVRGFDHDE